MEILLLLAALGFAGWAFFRRKPVEDATVKAKEIAEKAEEKAPEDVVEAAKEALVKPPLITEVAPKEPVVVTEVIPVVTEVTPVVEPLKVPVPVTGITELMALERQWFAEGKSFSEVIALSQAYSAQYPESKYRLATDVPPTVTVVAPTPAPPPVPSIVLTPSTAEQYIAEAKALRLEQLKITEAEIPTLRELALKVNIELGGSYVSGVLTPPASWTGNTTEWSRHVEAVAIKRYHQLYG